MKMFLASGRAWDLILNIPEVGVKSTPAEIAKRYGHLSLARLLDGCAAANPKEVMAKLRKELSQIFPPLFLLFRFPSHLSLSSLSLISHLFVCNFNN